MPNMNDEKELYESFLNLVKIVSKLRDPAGGCPWDLEQTHESLKPYIIEECYEAIDAIDHNREALPGELGDVLLQVLMHSQIGLEEKTFTLKDVLERTAAKLVYRHPHVFGSTSVNSSSEVLVNWEKLKQKKLEKEQSILDGVPRGMPALLRAQRIGEKAARVGFEWSSVKDVKDKIKEEVMEFLEEKSDSDKAAEEFGDLLFALTQLSRRLSFDSEALLHKAIDKFTKRFCEIERRVKKPLDEHTLDELNLIWDQIKTEE